MKKMLLEENIENVNHSWLKDHFSSMILPVAACIGEMSRYVLFNSVFQVMHIAVFVI
jgi:hypothetical protein